MAAPSFIAAGAGLTDAGGAWGPTGSTVFDSAIGSTGQIRILQILQDGSTAGAVAITSFSDIEALDGTDNSMTFIGSFNVGNPTAAIQHLWIGRGTSDTRPQVSGTNSTSEDLYLRAYRFADVSTGATLATVIENATAGSTVNEVGTSATAADAGVTTLGPDRLALNFVAVNDDNAISEFTGETGGDWSLGTAPYAEASGTDGAIGLQIARPGFAGNWQDANPTGVIGAASTTLGIAESFTTSQAGTADYVWFKALKNGTPTDTLLVEIQTDSGGLPSGTRVGSQAVVQPSSLGVGGTWTPCAVNASLSASTTYWVVAKRSGAADASNYYICDGDVDDVYSGARAGLNGTTWESRTGDIAFHVTRSAGATVDGGTGSIVDSDAWGVVGFALIGTTVEALAAVPRYGYVNYQDPGVF